MAAPTAVDVAQRPRDQNGKAITGVPIPGMASCPITVPQLNMRSIFSGTTSIPAGPFTGVVLIAALPVPAGTRLWSAMNQVDVNNFGFPFGDGPLSVLYVRFDRLTSGLVNVVLINTDLFPHTVDWAVGYVAANTALIPGATP
jgi:hypothetical protein